MRKFETHGHKFLWLLNIKLTHAKTEKSRVWGLGRPWHYARATYHPLKSGKRRLGQAMKSPPKGKVVCGQISPVQNSK